MDKIVSENQAFWSDYQSSEEMIAMIRTSSCFQMKQTGFDAPPKRAEMPAQSFSAKKSKWKMVLVVARSFKWACSRTLPGSDGHEKFW